MSHSRQCNTAGSSSTSTVWLCFDGRVIAGNKKMYVISLHISASHSIQFNTVAEDKEKTTASLKKTKKN